MSVKHVRVVGERGTTVMTVAWAPDITLPGVYDITFIQETGSGIDRKRHQIEIALCRKTMQQLVDEIFKGEP